MNSEVFTRIIEYLQKVPSIKTPISSGMEEGRWWIKFSIDINHDLAWNVVQEFGYVLNYISVNNRLPTTFYPVSPPPYLNGGPEDYLSWVIENKDYDFSPTDVMEWLQSRLPNPVNDVSQWKVE